MITHLEPDIVECEVRWVLGSISFLTLWTKLVEVMEFQFSNPKRWCCESAAFNMPANLENSTVATGLEKVSFHSISKKGNDKECSNYCTIACIWHTSKVMLKILQARLQQYVNRELPDVQAGFRKGRGTRDQIANIRWITDKAREFREKHLLLLYWLRQSLWLCGSQQTVEKSSRDGIIRPHFLPPEKPVCRSRSSS